MVRKPIEVLLGMTKFQYHVLQLVCCASLNKAWGTTHSMRSAIELVVEGPLQKGVLAHAGVKYKPCRDTLP